MMNRFIQILNLGQEFVFQVITSLTLTGHIQSLI